MARITGPLRRGVATARTALRRTRRGRLVLLSSTVLGLIVAPFASGAVSTGAITGGARNPTANTSSSYSKETQIIGSVAQGQGGVAANTGGYVTRQSNKSDSGGGAIYGCRAKPGTEACVSANNLNNGDAFRFQTSPGANTVGVFRFGLDLKQLVDKAPFATNGTAVVANLNADKVDGKSAEDFAAKTDLDTLVPKGSLLFAAVGADGAIAANRGVPAHGKATVATDGNGNEVFTVPFSGDLSACAYTASPTDVNATTIAVAPGSDKSTVVVTEKGSTAYGFHLQVTC
ncbi:hypothetical protein FSW04_12295 [Baekduia soli]|uniref:Uncharacterized protein n=1 Tax=Baekduia soli TaxID=496014 RepID=A0A5B8U572_9ACTN|nr:hypothetical protein [Baekduia soli]QEC48269.1 hypothetical protein FSW04_12295 [Baekduia soli]